MFERFGRASYQAGEIDTQHRCAVPEHNVIPDPRTDFDRDVQLFLAFAHEGIGLALAGLHFSAGKLPAAGERDRQRPFAREDAS
jgi:hypothetical protein